MQSTIKTDKHPLSNTGVICTLISNSNARIDWLTLSFRGGVGKDTIKTGFFDVFEVKDTETRNRSFLQIFEIYFYEKIIGTMATNCYLPNSSDLVQFTFKNNIFYNLPQDIEYFTNKLINVFNLKFTKISRIDICKDFNLFDNQMKPENLIQKFLTSEIVLKGKRNFSVFGKAGRSGVKKMETLKLGTYNSDVYSKLYNKTEEMKVNFKEYIFDVWKKNNLLQDKSAIFRLEFTVQGKHELLLNLGTKNNCNLSIQIRHLIDQKFLNDLFFDLSQKYFIFKYNRNIKNKSRLFECPLINKNKESIYSLQRVSGTKIIGRSETIFINKFNKIIQNCEELNTAEIKEARILFTKLKNEMKFSKLENLKTTLK